MDAARKAAPLQASPALADGDATGGRDLLRELSEEAARDDAILLLHAELLSASRFEVARRRGGLAQGDVELDCLAQASAAAALEQVLAHLDEYRGSSRFTTWASKYALLETAVRMRKLDWHARRRPADDPSRACVDTALPAELRSTLAKAIEDVLSPQQRHVYLTIAFTAMPIDVLADQLGATRADVYETLRAARRLLRKRLAADA